MFRDIEDGQGMPGRQVNDINGVRRKYTDRESDNPDVVLEGRTTDCSSVSIEVIVVSLEKVRIPFG